MADPMPPKEPFAPRGVVLPGWLRRGSRAGGGSDGDEGGNRFGALPVLFGVLVLLFLIVLGLRVLRERSRGDSKPQAATLVTAPLDAQPSGPEGTFRAAPGFRIYPQRAEAGLPLQLEVTGRGCPGASGVLSITEIGTAAEVGGEDRLVVRRRFAVDAARSFTVTPLLVGQPAGSYRVVAACERQPTASAPDGAARRDLFTMTEVLELTGPRGARDFHVQPTTATPGLATRVALRGESCVGSNARAVIRIFPPNTGADPDPTELTFPASGGTWRGEYLVTAEAAIGTYVIEARCVNADGLVFVYVTRTVRFATASARREGEGLFAGLFSFLSPGTEPQAPPAAEHAVTAPPRYTG